MRPAAVAFVVRVLHERLSWTKWIVDATISTAFVLASAADADQVVRAAYDFAVSWNEGADAGVRQAAEALVLAAGGNLPDLDVGVAVDRARARRDGDLRGMALSIYESLRPEVEAYDASAAHGDGGSA